MMARKMKDTDSEEEIRVQRHILYQGGKTSNNNLGSL